MISRKNPIALIKAFKKAFTPNEKVSLILKMKNSNINKKASAELLALSRDANIKIINENVSGHEMVTLYQTAYCYVSLHRSEGLGLGMANSMYLGKPVIGTGYSGNMDFMKSDNSYLVDYSIVEISENTNPSINGTSWADPHVEHAAQLMRYVYDNQEESSALGEKAAEYMRKEYNLEVATKIITDRINAIVRS